MGWGFNIEGIGNSLKEAKTNVSIYKDDISKVTTEYNKAVQEQNKKDFVDIQQKQTTITIPHDLKNDKTVLYVGGAVLAYLILK